MYSKIQFKTTDKAYIDEINQFIESWFNDDEFIYSNTSGSTGNPKKVKLLKKHLKASAQMTGNFFNFKESDTLLLSLPIFGIGGKMIIIRAIEFNCNLIVVKPTQNPLQEVRDYTFKIISLVPYQLNKIIDSDPTLLDKTKNVLIGGATVSSKLIEKIKVLPSKFFETFGMTETYSHIALKELKITQNFNTLKGISISKENECLVIDAPALDIKSLKTNDCVEIITSNEFNWLGRFDFVINSGGIKLHPEIIENKIQPFLNSNFFISKRQNETLGEIVILIIETENIDKIKLIDEYKTVLRKYEIPKEIYTLREFVYTSTQKINKIESLKLIDFK